MVIANLYTMSPNNLLLWVLSSLQSYPVYVTGQNEMFSVNIFNLGWLSISFVSQP